MSTHVSRAGYHKLPPSQKVLIALMNNKRDFAIAREQGWYRIPVKSAPRGIDASRIAFYQTSAFKEEKWSVRYFAEIKSREVVKRRDLLPEEAHHARANTEYFKLHLGELQTLEKPILSKRGRRLVFIPTTLKKFEAAEEINDLFHESPLEDDVWSALRRRGLEAERQLRVSIDNAKYCLDFALFCRDGQIDIECDGDAWHARRANIASDNERDNNLTSSGWAVLRFNTLQIRSDLKKCLETVRRTILRNGGLSEADLDRFLGKEKSASMALPQTLKFSV